MKAKASLFHLLLVACTCISVPTVQAQSFSETLQYINRVSNEEADYLTKKQDQRYVWKVSADGLLSMMVYHRDGYVLFSRTCYLKKFCDNIECADIRAAFALPDSNEPPSTILSFNNKDGRQIRLSLNSENSANRIRNAVFRLANLSKTNKLYKSKDPFDY